MNDSYQHLDDTALHALLTQHQGNLRDLETHAAGYGEQVPLDVRNQLDVERQEIARILAEQHRRKSLPSVLRLEASEHSAAVLPHESAALLRAPGSPFVVGRPLRATDSIFGRAEAFRFIAGELAHFNSVNIIGERRMGKTSLLTHLLAHQNTYLPAQPDQPPLVLARIDLQAHLSSALRLYGAALRELLGGLPTRRSNEARELASLRQQLETTPEADYDTLQHVLRQLRDPDGVCVRPVLVVDEFERLLDPEAQAGFPYPDFFNGLRALITADLLAMVVASRRPLAEYFQDPARPQTLTSTFPNYFIPYTLPLFDTAAADALLLQPSDHPLASTEAAEARRWACGHPCHLQVAGAAYYQGKVEGRPHVWVKGRREEVKRQNCMTGTTPRIPSRGISRLLPVIRAIVWDAPLWIGRLPQRLGATIDDIGAWILGLALIVICILLVAGWASGTQVMDLLLKGLGLKE